MFETENFKTQLAGAVSREAANNKLERYETEVVELLQRLASANETTLMESEERKPVTERRGTSDALNSARELVREASKYAAADKRLLLKAADIEQAYRAKYCKVWPFCKP